MNTAQEKNFSECYEVLQNVIQIDYNLALDVFNCVKDFISEHLETEMVIDSVVKLPENANFGASVKIEGRVSFVLGVFADKNTFHEIAERYEQFPTESLDEDFDAVSELLNVITGNLIVKIAEKFGIEEDLEPPRYGQIEKTFDTIKIFIGSGAFYLYIGREEIF